MTEWYTAPDEYTMLRGGGGNNNKSAEHFLFESVLLFGFFATLVCMTCKCFAADYYVAQCRRGFRRAKTEEDPPTPRPTLFIDGDSTTVRVGPPRTPIPSRSAKT
jgi:hypothetical protein